MGWLIILVVFLMVLWVIAELVLAGPSLREFDYESAQVFPDHPDDDHANNQILNLIQQTRRKSLLSKSPKQGLAIIRQFADELSQDLQTDTEFLATTVANTTAEWAIAKNVDPNRRVLFFHGGAFFLGSAKGHRKFSDRLSRICNAAVLSVNYSLMPENRRVVGINEAQAAYDWILKNAPGGQSDCGFLLLAGDSAGGNLAFMLSNWSRLKNLRRPDGVIGFSPSLDSTISSRSIAKNRKSDHLLGPSVGKITRLPRPLLLWLMLFLLRIRPANPLVSPIFSDLDKLPPTLIQVSNSEMLVGEAIRYTNKALAAGSPVILQVWEKQLHDWQLFNMGSGSAEQAWLEVQRFVDRL